jgi:hypothetical protein
MGPRRTLGIGLLGAGLGCVVPLAAPVANPRSLALGFRALRHGVPSLPAVEANLRELKGAFVKCVALHATPMAVNSPE